jgi:hypothetical protein
LVSYSAFSAWASPEFGGGAGLILPGLSGDLGPPAISDSLAYQKHLHFADSRNFRSSVLGSVCHSVTSPGRQCVPIPVGGVLSTAGWSIPGP